MRAVIFVTFALLAGCASSLERVQSVREAAPDWYDARKVEIAGKDYPKVSDVPTFEGERETVKKLSMSKDETLRALNIFQTDPRAEGPVETAAEMQAWAAAARRAVERQITQPDFLDDDEVEALKRVFDTRRGRL